MLIVNCQMNPTGFTIFSVVSYILHHSQSTLVLMHLKWKWI